MQPVGDVVFCCDVQSQPVQTQLLEALERSYETLRSPEAPDQMFATFHAEPGSSSEAALQLLADSLHSQGATSPAPRTSFVELDARRPS